MTSSKANTAVTAVMDPAPSPSEAPGTTREALQYFPRWVEAGKLIALNGYRLKSYAMYLSQGAAKEVLSDSDLQNLLKKCLPPSTDPLDHGIGFVLVHYARDGNYLLVSRWYGGNMLKHELFVLSHAAQGWVLQPAPAPRAMGSWAGCPRRGCPTAAPSSQSDAVLMHFSSHRSGRERSQAESGPTPAPPRFG